MHPMTATRLIAVRRMTAAHLTAVRRMTATHPMTMLPTMTLLMTVRPMETVHPMMTAHLMEAAHPMTAVHRMTAAHLTAVRRMIVLPITQIMTAHLPVLQIPIQITELLPLPIPSQRRQPNRFRPHRLIPDIPVPSVRINIDIK
jgi:hypothetical protein